MVQLTKTRAAEILQNLRDRYVLVLGDVMLDEFVWGDVTRISPEAPVPVVDVRRESMHLGGAANVLATWWRSARADLSSALSVTMRPGDDCKPG
jgi:bifunctional ADP-heptose synthase (sugar kinase/adenylyltransferase)